MQLKNLFSTKHQRLVNQCYPPGKTVEKRAKSSETSYLIYYVNSRRTKLEKVSIYLLKRSTKDIVSKRIGNVCVTLELMGKIISSCKENLGVFLTNFLKILLSIETNAALNGDSLIITELIQVLEKICMVIDVNLITPSQLTSFEKFIELYFTKICGDSKSKGVQTKQYNDYTLKGCIAITYIKGIKFIPSLKKQLSMGAYQSLKLFQEQHPQYQTVDLTPTCLNRKNNLDTTNITSTEDGLNKRLTLTRSVTNRQLGLDDYSDDKNADLSIVSLKRYFNTMEAEMLPISIRSLIKVLTETPNKELFEFVVNGIPVQTRYLSILIIVSGLSTESSVANSIVQMKLISSLMYTEVSIVGLSVVDLIKKLLSYQISKYSNKEIVDQCTITIGDLNTRTFYKDQTVDVIQEFLTKLNNLAQNMNMENAEDIRMILTNDLKYLILLVSEKQCIPLNLFNELIPLVPLFSIEDTKRKNIFDLVQKSTVTPISMIKVFKSLYSVEDEKSVAYFMHNLFIHFGSVALLSGLIFYQEPENCRASTQYYMYHLEASMFLQLKDYEQQALGNENQKTTFANSCLLNFYNDEGANKYARKGQKILNASSASSVRMAKTLSPSSTFAESEKKDDSLIEEGLENFHIAGSPFPVPHSSTANQYITAPKLRTPSSNTQSFDSKSLHSLSYNKPHVSQLRAFVKPVKSKADLQRNRSQTRASQSVKSKVTNITFLLSELNDQSSDIPIRDPDEEDPVGLENYGKASTQSKLKRASLKRISNMSLTLGSVASNVSLVHGHQITDLTNEEQSDAFVDAEDEVSLNDTNRGKLFE